MVEVMEHTQTNGQEGAQSEDLTPPEFASRYGINQQNVYYWIRRHSMGYKDKSGHWWLTKEDQQRMLQLEEERSPAKKFAKDPHSKNVRKRATESIDSIIAKFSIGREKAKIFNLLINYPFNEELLNLIETFATFDEPYTKCFEHEKLLMMMGKMLGLSKIGAIAIKDGYPFFKFVEPRKKGDLTVVYNVRTQIFYIDSVEKILERSKELVYQPTEISFS